MLSLLICGPKHPKNEMGVYLQPSIEELKDLEIDDLEINDALLNETFRMHTALLWTINEFSAYAVLSCWSTKGIIASPCYMNDVSYE